MTPSARRPRTASGSAAAGETTSTATAAAIAAGHATADSRGAPVRRRTRIRQVRPTSASVATVTQLAPITPNGPISSTFAVRLKIAAARLNQNTTRSSSSAISSEPCSEPMNMKTAAQASTANTGTAPA